MSDAPQRPARAADPARTLPGLLQAAAAVHGHRTAVIEAAPESVRTLTYAELAAAARAAALELAAAGIGRGDAVGIWLPNVAEYLVWEFAAAFRGTAVIGINTRYGAHELAHILAQGRPAAIVMLTTFLDMDFDARLDLAMLDAARISPDVPAPLRLRVAGAGAIATTSDEVSDLAAPQDRANYFTTSGSTGAPKLAGHDQEAVVRHAHNVAAALDMQPTDVLLGVLPLSGVFGFNPAIAALAAGATCLLEPIFDAARIIGEMQRFGVTHAIGGDDMFGRLQAAWAEARVALPSWRRGGIADFTGQSRAIVEWAEREFGTRISGVYGSSELFALSAIWNGELSADDRARGGGSPVSPNVEVRVVDVDTGEPRCVEELGELQFRGYNVLTDYLGRPGATAETRTADGWFRSGDLGFLTGCGSDFVYLCRNGDALRLRGFLVEPAEIEQFLMRHPEVTAARVVGVSTPGSGDAAVAFVTLRDAARADEAELRRFCGTSLAAFKVPARINVIEEFPTTTGTNGAKILTTELRRWAEAQLAEEPA